MTAESLSSGLTSVGLAFANHIWQSTAFAAVVGLLTLVLRKHQARIRFSLWLAASIKFLVPFSLLIALGGLLPKPQQVVSGSRMGLYSAIDVAGQPFSVGSATGIGSAVPAESLLQRLTAQLPVVVTAVWILGAFVVLLVWVSRWRQAAAILRRASPIEHGREMLLLRRLEEAAGRQGRMAMRLSPERMEPGVFGVFRPVLIWPERLSERLDEEQMRAILAHEMSHERRHDNLAAAIHMVVEVLFWFHPMVWWMERRMVEERERACDEAVVRLGSSPEAYAEGLLRVCKFCVESRLACVSGIISGGRAKASLQSRIRQIVKRDAVLRLGLAQKSLLFLAAILSIAVPLLLGQSDAAPKISSASQSVALAAQPSSFDVVSIRPNKIGGQQQVGPTRDGYRMRNMFFIFPILTAYPPTTGAAMYSDDQIVGFPHWIYNDSYDIDAKISEAELADWQKPALQQVMLRSKLQSLLAERLKLAVHRQQREGKVLLLEVGKGDPKFKETDPAQPHAGMKLPGGVVWSTEIRDGQMISHYYAMSMPALASLLSNKAGIPVQDKTGLAGTYDITMKYPVPDCVPHCGLQGATASSDETSASSEASDLGLRLRPAKGEVEVLVLDHVERPSEN